MQIHTLVKKTTTTGLNYAEDLRAFLQPLHELNLNIYHFTYQRFRQLSPKKYLRIASINTNIEFMTQYLNIIDEFPEDSFSENFVERSIMHPVFMFDNFSEPGNKIHELMSKYEIGNCITLTLVDKISSDIEVFWFYIDPQTRADWRNQIINEVNTLKHFILSIKSHAPKLFQHTALDERELHSYDPLYHTQTKIINACEKLIKPDISLNNSIKLNCHQYHLGYPFHTALSIMETHILILYFRNASAKEIGQELGISFRTVEKHIDNIRFKSFFQESRLLRKALYDCPLFMSLV